MPQSKISMKSTVLDLELDDVEITVGPEIMRVGHLKASVDVADLLRVQLPELMKGEATGVMLLDHGEKKIQVIKAIRHLTCKSLQEGKEIAESTPVLIGSSELILGDPNDLPIDKCHMAAKALEAEGATIEIVLGDERIPTVLDRFREMLVEVLARHGQVSKRFADE